jgi:hypothetical protein
MKTGRHGYPDALVEPIFPRQEIFRC